MTNGDPFALGVASGDPLPDRVVLWTHVGGEEERGQHRLRRIGRPVA